MSLLNKSGFLFLVIFTFQSYTSFTFAAKKTKTDDLHNSTIYYVNIEALNSKLNIVKKINDKMSEEFKKLEKFKSEEESALSSEYNELSSKIKSMSKKVAELKVKELEGKKKTFESKVKSMMSELQSKEQEVTKEYLSNLQSVINDYASNNDIPMIFNRSAMIFISKESNSLDLTDNIIKEANKKIKSLKSLKK